MKTKRWLFSVMAISLLMTLALTSGAIGAYPEKPIEIVVHASAGGGSDLFVRQLAQFLEKEGIVKQKIQVANRTGGGSTVAINFLDSKKGDPHVFMQLVTSPLTTMMRGTTRLKLEDMVLITKMIEDPNLVFTRYDSPYKTMKDVIDAARKAPMTVSFGNSGVGGTEHICAHRIEKAAGVKFNLISYKGGGEVAAALLGGHIDLAVANVSEQIGMIEAKKVRALATMTEDRVPFLPDVPSLKDQGINTSYTQFRGFWAAPGFPDYAVTYWENAFEKVMKVQGFRDYIKSIQGIESFLKHAEFKKFLGNYVEGLKQDFETMEMFKEKK